MAPRRLNARRRQIDIAMELKVRRHSRVLHIRSVDGVIGKLVRQDRRMKLPGSRYRSNVDHRSSLRDRVRIDTVVGE